MRVLSPPIAKASAPQSEPDISASTAPGPPVAQPLSRAYTAPPAQAAAGDAWGSQARPDVWSRWVVGRSSSGSCCRRGVRISAPQAAPGPHRWGGGRTQPSFAVGVGARCRPMAGKLAHRTAAMCCMGTMQSASAPQRHGDRPSRACSGLAGTSMAAGRVGHCHTMGAKTARVGIKLVGPNCAGDRPQSAFGQIRLRFGQIWGDINRIRAEFGEHQPILNQSFSAEHRPLLVSVSAVSVSVWASNSV